MSVYVHNDGIIGIIVMDRILFFSPYIFYWVSILYRSCIYYIYIYIYIYIHTAHFKLGIAS